LRKGPLAGAPTPRERERQIAPKKARHFSLKITGRSDSGRKKVLFDTDNLHETPEFGRRAKLAWIKAKRGAGGGT
jgi:hypothetical protein